MASNFQPSGYRAGLDKHKPMPYHMLSIHVKDAQAYELVWSWHMWSCTLQNILAFHKKKSRRISTEFRPAQSQVNRFSYNSVDFGRSANNFVRSSPGIWQDVGEGRHFYEPNWFVYWLVTTWIENLEIALKKKKPLTWYYTALFIIEIYTWMIAL